MTQLSPDQRILIIEHDELTTETFARMLRLEGYDVQTAFSAEDGLRDIESRHPDAIIVDFRMPGIDGLEFLRRLRARGATRTTPVAIVTGDYFIDDSVSTQLRELGAELRFKPLWVEDLTALVHDLLDPARER
jgi:DNA-binding response OmpR family regulator